MMLNMLKYVSKPVPHPSTVHLVQGAQSAPWLLPTGKQVMSSLPKKTFASMPTFGNLPFKQAPKLPFDPEKEYDLVVIGGGTGGISCA